MSWETTYKTYRPDRVVGKDGNTAVLFRCSVQHAQMHVPGLRCLEVTTVRIHVRKHGPLTIASVYVSLSRRLLVEDLKVMFSGGVPVFVTIMPNTRVLKNAYGVS